MNPQIESSLIFDLKSLNNLQSRIKEQANEKVKWTAMLV